MKNLRTKITLVICALLLIACVGMGISSYIISSKALVSNIESELTLLAKQGATIVDASLDAQWSYLEAIASNEKISNPNVPMSEKAAILQKETKKTGVVNITISDKYGNALSPDGVSTTNISDREYFKKAIAGIPSVSDPIENRTVPGTMIITYSIPLKWENQIVGILFKVADGNDLSNITDKITFGETGSAYMINNEAVTIANYNRDLVLARDNAITNAETNPAFKEMADIERKMLEDKSGFGSYTYNGQKKFIGYAPVSSAQWLLAVTIPEDEILSALTPLKLAIITFVVLFLIISTALGIILSGLIVRPLKVITERLAVIASGDFTGDLPSSVLKIKDETGRLARSLDSMQKSIKEVISIVKSGAAEVSENTLIQEQNVAELMEEIEDVSSTTEELSAGAEETAASTQEINASFSEIENAIESIAQSAQVASNTSSEIGKRAGNLKADTLASREKAHSVYTTSEGSLKKAIEQSREVQQINTMSEAILEITSQTNLLALNAAIEAARAGEAGKGFAVVADEIRNLAEDSKKTVEEIKQVTKTIIASVENLSESSMNMLDFIDKQVLNDYDKLVNSSEQYNNDSILINNIVTDLSATIEELSSTIQNITKAVNEITSATSDEADGTSHIAEKAVSVTDKASSILQYAGSTKSNSEKLVQAVSKFKV